MKTRRHKVKIRKITVVPYFSVCGLKEIMNNVTHYTAWHGNHWYGDGYQLQSASLAREIVMVAASNQAMSKASTPLPTANLLQEILQRKLSGSVTLADQRSQGLYWRIFVGNGLIHYATCTTRWPERIMPLVASLVPELVLSDPLGNQSDYEYLCGLWQSGHLSLQVLRQLLFRLTQEALVHCLVLPQPKFQLERNLAVDPILISASIKDLVVPAKDAVNRWLKIRDRVESPMQRLGSASVSAIEQQVALMSPSAAWASTLVGAVSQQQSLYQTAHTLGSDALSLSEWLVPLLAEGKIAFATAKAPARPLIACIDDSNAVQRKVKLTLEAAGYDVVGITEPARALTTFVRQRPVLILMDITMPEINGYELCKMLKQSALLKEVPVVMLTGRDGIIDRLRARAAGASDYMTKPFEPHQLLTLLDQYIIATVAA